LGIKDFEGPWKTVDDGQNPRNSGSSQKLGMKFASSSRRLVAVVQPEADGVIKG
jgi:hypothetical protein